MKKKLSLNKIKLILFGLYFLILTTERVISLVVCMTEDMSSHDGLDYYMMALTIAAIFGAYSFAVVRFRTIFAHHEDAESADDADFAHTKPDVFGSLSIAAGILLLGGMVHTDGTIAPMQFVSYGMLLGAMAVHTAENVKLRRGGDRKWLSFAYITAYSMAIPVVYHTSIELAGLFIPIEIVVSAGMVVLFTIMLRSFFVGEGESNFSLLPFLTAIFGDFLVLELRWHEEVNLFVLIFVCIMSVLWFAGNVLSIKKK